MRAFLFALGVTALGLAAVAPLSAVTVVPLSFSQLTGTSTAVVHARVVDVRGQWTADRRGIESLVTVDALGYLKGDLGARVLVRVPGGEAGGLVNIIPGMPRLATGDHVVLFLTGVAPGIPVVTGTTQGVFRVTTDPRSGGLMVIPPAVSAAGPQGARLARGDVARRPMALSAFELVVKQHVAEAAR